MDIYGKESQTTSQAQEQFEKQLQSRVKSASSMSNSTSLHMEDSGTSSILSNHSELPTVKMPGSPTQALQDSGICSDFAGKLNLSEDSKFDPSSYFTPDEDGDVQLHLAVASGLADVVDALVRMAPTPQLLSMQNNQGYTPLHIAVLQNQPSTR